MWARSVGGLGYGQTWHNMIGQRTLGQTYTNNLSKPIYVVVVTSSSTRYTTMTGYVSGVPVGYGYYSTNALLWWTFPMIVPPGESYSVSPTGGGYGLTYWSELY